MNYNELVEQCFFQVNHSGTIENKNALSVKVSRGSLAQNEYYDWYMSYNSQAVITNAVFQSVGSPYLIAGLEWCCRQLINSPLHLHPWISAQLLVEKLELPRVRYPLAILIEMGYKKAIHLIQTNIESLS